MELNSQELLQWLTDNIHKPATTSTPKIDVGALVELSERKDIESSSIAKALYGLMEKHRALTKSDCVLRIAEVAQRPSYLVLDALSSRGLPEGVVVEYFLASQSPELIQTMSRQHVKRPSGLRLRFLLINDKAVGLDVKDVSFDVVMLNDWSRSGAAAWSGKGHTPEDVFMDKFGRHLAPQAQVIVRGFGARAIWPALLFSLGAGQLKVDLKDPVNVSASLTKASECLAGYGSTVSTPLVDEGTKVVLCTMPSFIPLRHSRVLIVTDHVERAAAFEAKLRVVQPDVITDRICFDGDEGPDDLKEALIDRLALFLPSPGQQSIIFIAGIGDTSPIGEVGFQRLLEVSRLLNEEETRSLLADCLPVPFWVVTEGAYFGRLRPEQSSLQGFTLTLSEELSRTTFLVKYADMSDANEMGLLAELVLSECREQLYALDHGHLKVMRFHRIDSEAILKEEVCPTDIQRRFVADCDPGASGGVGMGYRFIIEPIPQPGEEEVQVQVYAAGINFRDVVSLLPCYLWSKF